MDIQIKNEDYNLLEIIDDCTIEECVEGEISLPEYMPEILRIIKSSADVKINSCKLVGERVTVDGVCEMRIVYTCEDNGIYTFSQSRAFTRHCENPKFTDGCDCSAKVSVAYVNCRATGTKKAEIKAGITIKPQVYMICREKIIKIDDCCLQEKTEDMRAMCLGCRSSRGFSLSDTVSLDIPCGFIINSKACAIPNEIRKINNKVMIKGDCLVDISYVNFNDKTVSEHLRHCIPINQILEFDGMDEKYTGSVTLDVTALDILPKGEANGVTSAFDVSVGVNASVTMWEEKELSLITDAYSVDSVLKIDKSPYEFLKAVDEVREIYNFDDSFSISGEGVEKVVDTVGVITDSKLKVENNELTISGEISLALIIKDSKGALSNINKVIDFSFKRRADYQGENAVGKPNLTLVSIACEPKNENEIAVRGEINISCSVFEKITVETITNISLSEEPLVKNTNAITVYFPEKNNESLWNIARRYNTTVEAISKENGLEGDTTENLKTVFIPSA